MFCNVYVAALREAQNTNMYLRPLTLLPMYI